MKRTIFSLSHWVQIFFTYMTSKTNLEEQKNLRNNFYEGVIRRNNIFVLGNQWNFSNSYKIGTQYYPEIKKD